MALNESYYRKRAWEILQEIRWVLKDAAGA
jgi:hypothetical protein